MKRPYNNTVANDVQFFVGDEIEKTPAYGMRTLFVVGVHDSNDILGKAHFPSNGNISHIYFGANQSFKSGGSDDFETWNAWNTMIQPLLDAGFWCTLDVDISEVPGLVESGLCENRRFIPMISAKIPFIDQLNYNATIKIDDIGFEASNPGVWCHRVRTLTNIESFTEWDKYTKDRPI